jgi:hypothetical protein
MFAQLLKSQRLQIRLLRATAKLDRRTPVRELHVTFKITCVYGHVTELCRTQAEVNVNHIHPYIHGTGQGEARGRKYRRFKLAGGQAYDPSAE